MFSRLAIVFVVIPFPWICCLFSAHFMLPLRESCHFSSFPNVQYGLNYSLHFRILSLVSWGDTSWVHLFGCAANCPEACTFYYGSLNLCIGSRWSESVLCRECGRLSPIFLVFGLCIRWSSCLGLSSLYRLTRPLWPLMVKVGLVSFFYIFNIIFYNNELPKALTTHHTLPHHKDDTRRSKILWLPPGIYHRKSKIQQIMRHTIRSCE